MHGRRRAFDVMLRGRADSLLGAVQDAEDPEDNVAVDPTELVLPKQDVYRSAQPVRDACWGIRRLRRLMCSRLSASASKSRLLQLQGRRRATTAPSASTACA